MAKLTAKKEKKPKSNLIGVLDQMNSLSTETYDSYTKKKREEIEAEAAVTSEEKALILKKIVDTQPIDLLVTEEKMQALQKEKKRKSFWDSVPGRAQEQEDLWIDFPTVKNKEPIGVIDSIGLSPKDYIATSEEVAQDADGPIGVKIPDNFSKPEVVQQTGSKSKSLREDPWKKLFKDGKFIPDANLTTISGEAPILVKHTLSSGTAQSEYVTYTYGDYAAGIVAPLEQNSKPVPLIDEKMPYLKKEEVPSKIKVIKKDVFYGKTNLKDRQYITIGEPFISPITKQKYTLANVDGINDYVSIPLEEEKDEIK